MENFIVSARKYRPVTFDSVVGQQSITRTLKNAIKNKQLAHAYLFCGPRGVGKTTCARIFAKTINCSNLSEDAEPCNQCESCKAFNQQRSYNIHELDAASNNSVEDIRSLTDQVRIPPQIGTHSVYIIDEVHMLSSAAFNAFLKTLEEPPNHAIFILATTEKHKIIPTILSRCQIFDFNRIRVEDAANHLGYVAQKEGVDAEPEALHVIAQKADGAMRDALSFFDQIVSFSGKKISYKDAINNLNVLDYDYYFKLVEAFLSGDFSSAMLIFDSILNKGFDGHHFIAGLSSHIRDLMVCSDPETVELLEVGAGIRENYKKQAQQCKQQFLLKALKISNDCDVSYKMSSNQRLHIELALLQICNLVNEKKNDELSAENETKPQKTENKQPTKPETDKKPQKKEIPKLKDALNGKIIPSKQQENESVNDKEADFEAKRKKEFTQTDLKKVWLDFAGQFKNRPRYLNMLKSHIPVLKEKNNLILKVNNRIQLQDLESKQREILNYLKDKLENDSLTLELSIDKDSPQKRLYTDRDKYNYLTQKNPKLEELRNKFDLDI